jgi:hypothetical protein
MWASTVCYKDNFTFTSELRLILKLEQELRQFIKRSNFCKKENNFNTPDNGKISGNMCETIQIKDIQPEKVEYCARVPTVVNEL